ncbi:MULTISPECIES: hypothetical protein [Pseudoalteromonas]|uniref:hypothetical protein n=1 Tax=Pseudoalteromonas TaxID=53246 RepID=UPI00037653C8|nr:MULTISPECIES: hypothetical protein [Pseudoalteromonas]MDP4487633.1 hypothetical protein [Pseudoalteromonas piscicida]WMO13166.1 hypothetical protein NI376_13980 [Pseudoalteromonas piscicida]
MRRVVIFNKKKHFFWPRPDVNSLNQEIEQIEQDGWKVLSVTANCDFLGYISSFTILIES